jgi:replication initiation and membrane attachment protein DnaB
VNKMITLSEKYIKRIAQEMAKQHVPKANTPYESMAVNQARGWVRSAVKEAIEIVINQRPLEK